MITKYMRKSLLQGKCQTQHSSHTKVEPRNSLNKIIIVIFISDYFIEESM